MDTPTGKNRSMSRSRKYIYVKHTDPWSDAFEAALTGTERYTDRRHSRFQRKDIAVHVRSESRMLDLFRVPAFRPAELKDISVSGASFHAASLLWAPRISLKLRFKDGTEFVLPARILKRHQRNLHRVQFLEHDPSFADHLLKSSLNLRFRD